MELDKHTIERIAKACIPLVLHQNEWINRRVEEFNFNDEGTVRHQMGIDLSLTELNIKELCANNRSKLCHNDKGNNQQIVVPLGFIRKRANYLDLDIRDHEGHSVSLLPTDERDRISKCMLFQLVNCTGYKPHPSTCPSLDVALYNVINKDIKSLYENHCDLKDYLTDHQELLSDDSKEYKLLHVLLSNLLYNHLLLARTDAKNNQIIKIAYNEPIHVTRTDKHDRYSIWEQVEWQDDRISLLTPTVDDCKDYIGEIVVPEGVRIKSAKLHSSNGNKNDKHVQGIRRWKVIQQKCDNGKLIGSNKLIRVELSLSSIGFIVAARLVSLAFTAIIATSVAARIAGSNPPPNGSAAVAITFAFLGLVTAFIIRPGAHPFEQTIDNGIRLLLVIQLFLALVFLSEIVFFNDRYAATAESIAVDVIWYVILLLSLVITGVIWGGIITRWREYENRGRCNMFATICLVSLGVIVGLIIIDSHVNDGICKEPFWSWIRDPISLRIDAWIWILIGIALLYLAAVGRCAARHRDRVKGPIRWLPHKLIGSIVVNEKEEEEEKKKGKDTDTSPIAETMAHRLEITLDGLYVDSAEAYTKPLPDGHTMEMTEKILGRQPDGLR